MRFSALSFVSLVLPVAQAAGIFVHDFERDVVFPTKLHHRNLTPPCKIAGKKCRNNSDCCSGGCTDSTCDGGIPGPSPPPPGPAPPPGPSFDGVCTCGICPTGSPNEGKSCRVNTDCGGKCVGGDTPGKGCLTSSECLPNKGRSKGQCDLSVPFDACESVSCPKPHANIFATSYRPGNFNQNTKLYDKYGREVIVSDGLNGRAIAYAGEAVQLYNADGTCAAEKSSTVYHDVPDGGDVFDYSDEPGVFYYSSNSERDSGGGGVGTIKFNNATGDPIGYYRTLSGTSRNCGGGKTPWGTWVSCEETGSGRVYQIDPRGSTATAERTEVVAVGGAYESFAWMPPLSPGNLPSVDNPPTFYITNDSSSGQLTRYTPGSDGIDCYNSQADSDRWCTLTATNGGKYDYLLLSDTSCPSGGGTFSWTQSLSEGQANAALGFPYGEGIDVVGNKIYFVSKTTRRLYILTVDSLNGGTFECSSTQSTNSDAGGAFQAQPDQIQAIVNDPDGIVYFCEDGSNDCGVHGRDQTGKFFSILDGPGYATETTGLAFTEDHKFMFVSFQDEGVTWQFWREDGLPFNGPKLDIKYHAN